MKKCPICDCENGDNFKFCCECGATLAQNDPDTDEDIKIFVSPDETINNDTVSYDDDAETVDTSFVSSFDEPKAKSAKQPSYDDESFDDIDVKPKKNKKKEKPADKSELTFNSYDDDDSTDIFDEEDTKQDMKASASGDIAFICITLVLILLIVGLSAVYINRSFPGKSFKEKVAYIFTSTFTDDIITRKPTIEPSKTSEGEPAIIITVYARKGCVVTFREGATSMESTVEGQSIAFRVPTSLWTSSVKDGDIGSVMITPNVFVRDPSRSNSPIQLEFEPYSAALQEVDITITSPSTMELNTSSTSISIEGFVSDAGVAVFMNGNQLQLDENGYFRTVYHVTEDGEQKVVFTAQKSGYAIGSKVLKINYSKSNIELDIYNESLRTFDDTLEITGKIKSGMKLEVAGVELDGDIKIDRHGEFKFVAKLPGVGNYTITLKVKDGDKESSMDIYAEHAPNMEEYMRTTNNFDYDWLLKHPTMDKHFGITGTVTEIYQTKPYVRAKLHTSSSDVIFTYYYTTEVATDDNKTYRIYAYPDGTDSETGLPQVYCWFIYKS